MVWLIDAVSGDRPPGTVSAYEHQRLLELSAGKTLTHQTNLGESLRWMLHTRPDMNAIEFRLYGIEAGTMRSESSLGAVVRNAINSLVGEIMSEARKLAESSTRFPIRARD